MERWDDPHDEFRVQKEIPSTLIYGRISQSLPEVSIVIPTYRRADLLKNAVNSALCQEEAPRFEIIVIDNDSDIDQETDSLMLAFCKNHDNILYYRNGKNLGSIGNWNRCVEMSRSNIFCILHDDDQLLPGYLKTVYPIARKRIFGAIGVFNQYIFYSGEADRIRENTDKSKQYIAKLRRGRPLPFQLKDAVEDMRPSPTAGLYNKQACMEIGGFVYEKLGKGMVSDNVFFCQMRKKWPVYQYPEILALRGVGNNSSTDPQVVCGVIKGSYSLNEQIVESDAVKAKRFYRRINEMMTVSLIYSYIHTYNVDLDISAICDDLGISQKGQKTSTRTLKLLRILFWLKAIVRPSVIRKTA